MSIPVITHFVRIPVNLHQKEFFESVGVGLYELLNGQRPILFNSTNSIEIHKIVKTRIYLSDFAENFLKTLQKLDEFNSKNEILTVALAYVAEQPAWVRATKI
ncbi:MAG: hypothetical protein GY710_05910 [Desulfobacteraceae bacterium]|nr:hypothetical protein [Desulfobacteraceae bacterium]